MVDSSAVGRTISISTCTTKVGIGPSWDLRAQRGSCDGHNDDYNIGNLDAHGMMGLSIRRYVLWKELFRHVRSTQHDNMRTAVARSYLTVDITALLILFWSLRMGPKS